MPRAYVQEQAFGTLQGFFIVGGDGIGGRLGVQIGRRLADNIVARQPELSLGDPIDQHVSAIAHVLHGDLGRNVIDNLPQEAVVAITLLLDMPPLGDVFDRRHPPAMRQGLVDDVKRTSVRGFHDGMGYFSLCEVLQDVRAKFLDITLKRTGFLTVPDDVEEMAARLDDVRRQTAHVDIALVADYHARRLVIQHQTLGHVVEGSVEAMFFRCELLLRLLILPVHLADDQEQNEGDHQGRQNGGSNHETGLGPPVREYDCYGAGRHDDDGEAAQRSRGSEPVLLIDTAFETQRLQTALGPNLLQQRRCL